MPLNVLNLAEVWAKESNTIRQEGSINVEQGPIAGDELGGVLQGRTERQLGSTGPSTPGAQNSMPGSKFGNLASSPEMEAGGEEYVA